MLSIFSFPKIRALLILIFCLGLAACNSESDSPETATPVAKTLDWWQKRHQDIVAQDKSDVALVFIGDSITHQWEEPEFGYPIWLQYFAHFNALNMGFDSDKTQHVLWRVQNGELDNMSPKYVVIMIGTNNVKSDSSADIALGIEAIVNEVLKRLPETKIILHRIFPRGDAENPAREITDEASAIAQKVFSGEPRVIFADINAYFEDNNGNVPTDIMYDSVHPTTKGYQIWADALLDYIQ
ncbi:GDSL-type esterase/lipase family protein [Colwellia sp. MEBiC06753]